MNAFLELSHLGKTYDSPNGPAVIVDGFDLRLVQGEFVTLIGHSGCGKSTVLSIVAGLTGSSTGGVILDGREIGGPGPDRGVVFQSPCLLPWLTAQGNVMLGVRKVYPHVSERERDEIVAYALALVGLEAGAQKYPRELSAGMKQRVGIARAIALCPKVLLLDEPFGMLDSLTRIELQDLILEIWERERTTTLMVTHDVDEAIFLSDRIAMMTAGPRARLGGILHVPFERPRDRGSLLGTDEYYDVRDRIISFLEHQVLPGSAAAAA